MHIGDGNISRYFGQKTLKCHNGGTVMDSLESSLGWCAAVVSGVMGPSC